MKNNFFAPLWGWLLGLLELSAVVLVMPYDTNMLVKIIYILSGAIGSAFIITLSNRISPINSKSIEAGEALGLSKAELFRQVIVPDGRPGLWQLYNRGKLLSLRRFRNA
jgi:ABC-type arginine transport system permease subunit